MGTPSPAVLTFLKLALPDSPVTLVAVLKGLWGYRADVKMILCEAGAHQLNNSYGHIPDWRGIRKKWIGAGRSLEIESRDPGAAEAISTSPPLGNGLTKVMVIWAPPFTDALRLSENLGFLSACQLSDIMLINPLLLCRGNFSLCRCPVLTRMSQDLKSNRYDLFYDVITQHSQPQSLWKQEYTSLFNKSKSILLI